MCVCVCVLYVAAGGWQPGNGACYSTYPFSLHPVDAASVSVPLSSHSACHCTRHVTPLGMSVHSLCQYKRVSPLSVSGHSACQSTHCVSKTSVSVHSTCQPTQHVRPLNVSVHSLCHSACEATAFSSTHTHSIALSFPPHPTLTPSPLCRSQTLSNKLHYVPSMSLSYKEPRPSLRLSFTHTHTHTHTFSRAHRHSMSLSLIRALAPTNRLCTSRVKASWRWLRALAVTRKRWALAVTRKRCG